MRTHVGRGREARGRLRVGALGALVTSLLLTSGLPAEAPVADAAERGDLEAVRALLRDGADVNAAQEDGMTALHWAAEGDDARMARVLLYAGANREATTRLGGITPLHLAARKGHAGALAALIEGGADVMARTASGATPLHLAAAAGSAAAVTALLDAGAAIDAQEAAAWQTPLHFAVAENRLHAMRVLIARVADLAATTRVVDYVERARADSEDRRRRERMLALRKELAAEASGLRVASAEQPDRQQERDRTVVTGPTVSVADQAAAILQGAGTGNEPPAEDAGEGAAAAAEEPEPLSFADLVGRQGGMTPLHYAARHGFREAARLLLDAGADVNALSGGDSSSPLLVASINGHYDLALELLGAGADPTLASDAGATPLFTTLNNRWAPKALFPQPTAFQQQEATHLDVMEALLVAGADPDARLSKHLWYTSFNFDLLGVDFMGATPFWRAAYALDVPAMKLLVAHGADPGIPTHKPAERRRRRSSGADEDPSGLPPVPYGGPAFLPIHAASGAGYGWARAGNSHRHVHEGWLPAVTYLVEELGADANARDHLGFNAVHHAAARGDNELILYLVEHGADPLAVGRSGQTTVDMANGPQQRVQPFPETIALLEGMGARNNHNCQSC